MGYILSLGTLSSAAFNIFGREGVFCTTLLVRCSNSHNKPRNWRNKKATHICVERVVHLQTSRLVAVLRGGSHNKALKG